MIIQFEYLIAA